MPLMLVLMRKICLINAIKENKLMAKYGIFSWFGFVMPLSERLELIKRPALIQPASGGKMRRELIPSKDRHA